MWGGEHNQENKSLPVNQEGYWDETNQASEGVEIIPGEGKETLRVGFFEGIYGILFQPVITLRQLGLSGRFRWGLLVYALVFLFSQVVGTLTDDLLWGPLLETWGLASITIARLSFFPIALAIIFAYVAILHACASLLGGQGQFRGLFVALAFAGFPVVIASLLGFINTVGGSWLKGITILLSFAIYSWVLILQIIGIRECHQVSTGKAVAIYLLPFLVFIVIVFWVVVLGATIFPHWVEALAI